MAKKKFVTRRRFMALAAAGSAAPMVIPGHVFGANERIVIGHIGVNNRGKDHVKRLAADTAALCDVDQRVLARERKTVTAAAGKCDTYDDYRRLLDRPDIDAVVVATPDHWHALVAVAACQAGKDVYCEKPLALTIAEGRALVTAARRHGRMVQTGSQQRSDGNFRYACELVRLGRLGRLQRIEAGLPKAGQSAAPVADQQPPAWLDYNRWLGPAPERPYNPMRIHTPHRAWRWWWDYSGGQMTNWGCHHLDIVQWALGTDDSGPVEITGTGQFHPDNWFPVPVTFQLTYRYADGTTVDAGTDYKMGVTFIGSAGSIYVTRGKISSVPAELIRAPIGPDDVHLVESTDHMDNFLQSIRSRKLPICDVEIGHRSATMAHLGNIAIRTGQTLRWDPVAEQITGSAEAAGMIERPYRAPWQLPG
jgi:predicted dehydrogenase